MIENPDIPVAKSDLERFHEVLDTFYHYAMAQDVLDAFRRDTKARNSALTKKAHDALALLNVYLSKEVEDVPDEQPV